jgi:hypothetical protein
VEFTLRLLRGVTETKSIGAYWGSAASRIRDPMRRVIHYCVRFHAFLYSRELLITDASIVRPRVAGSRA